MANVRCSHLSGLFDIGVNVTTGVDAALELGVNLNLRRSNALGIRTAGRNRRTRGRDVIVTARRSR